MANHFFSCFCLLFLTVQLVAQPQQVEVYSVDDGLAQSQVYAVLADSRGYVWAGTQGGGVSRFDGVSFTNFSTFDGLPGNYVNALMETSNGQVWIGTNKGLCTFDGRHFYVELTAWGNVKAMLEIEERGQVWVLCDRGLFVQEKGCWREVKLPKKGQPNTLGELNGTLILGTNQSAWKLVIDTWKRIPEKGSAWSNVWNLVNRNNGTLWASAMGRGLYRAHADSLRHFPTPAGVVLTALQSNAKDFWVGTQGQGLFVRSLGAENWIQIRERDGLGSNTVRAITEDKWGTIWVGTSGGGLCAIREAPFRAFGQEQGLPARPVYAVAGSDSLGVIFSVGTKGFMQKKRQLPERWQLDSILGAVKIRTMTVDDRNRIWLGTEGEGLLVYSVGGWQKIPEAGDHILHVLAGERGTVWLTTARKGLQRLMVFEDTSGLFMDLEEFDRNPYLPAGRIETIHKDRGGRLILGYRNKGIAAWRPDSLYWHIQQKDGLPVRGVRAIREDTTGYLWVATAGGLVQLTIYDATPKINVIGRQQGLQSGNLYCLEIDHKQDVWVGSEKGVEQLQMSGDRKIIGMKSFGKVEGFTGIETCTDAAFHDKDGNLWFGTMNGLMMYESSSFSPLSFPPPVLGLEDVRIQFKSLWETAGQQILSPNGTVRQEMSLSHSQSHLSFRLQAIDQARPLAIKYEWRLEGWENQWHPPTDQQEPVFVNVAPGNYVFEARAIGEGGRKSDMLRLPIIIHPPYWQTAQFRFIVGASLVLIFGLLIYLWLRRWKRKQKEVEDRLRMENHLLELEQKALQLQMNPHFIANAMQGIQYQLQEGRHEIARAYLSKFGKLMRSVLYHSRKNNISLEDEMENLKHYLDLERFRLGNRFDYTFHYDENLETALIQVPPMLLQPFLENAIHHGLKGKTSGGKIDIYFEEKPNNKIEVKITDNGQGLDSTKNGDRGDHQSTALKVIAERLTMFQKQNEGNEEPFLIEDVVVSGKVGGVRVQLVLPILG